MAEKRKKDKRKPEVFHFQNEHEGRVWENIRRMLARDEWSMAMLLGADMWFKLSGNEKRNLGRHMSEVFEAVFPDLEAVPKTSPKRYRLLGSEERGRKA